MFLGNKSLKCPSSALKHRMLEMFAPLTEKIKPCSCRSRNEAAVSFVVSILDGTKTPFPQRLKILSFFVQSLAKLSISGSGYTARSSSVSTLFFSDSGTSVCFLLKASTSSTSMPTSEFDTHTAAAVSVCETENQYASHSHFPDSVF